MSPSLKAKPYVGMHCDMVLLLQVTCSTMNPQTSNGNDSVTSSRRPNPDLLHAMLVMLSATGAGAREAAKRKALPGSAAAARDVAHGIRMPQPISVALLVHTVLTSILQLTTVGCWLWNVCRSLWLWSTAWRGLPQHGGDFGCAQMPQLKTRRRNIASSHYKLCFKACSSVGWQLLLSEPIACAVAVTATGKMTLAVPNVKKSPAWPRAPQAPKAKLLSAAPGNCFQGIEGRGLAFDAQKPPIEPKTNLNATMNMPFDF